MKNRIRLHEVTFGPEFPKPLAMRRKRWPHVTEERDRHGNVTTQLYLQGGLLFIHYAEEKLARCFHPANVEMCPYSEDVAPDAPQQQQPLQSVGGRK